jgi:peroxiredoxin
MTTFGLYLFLAATMPAIHAQTAPRDGVVPLSQIRPALNAEEKAIDGRLGQLRSLPDDEWTTAVAQLARQVQQLPMGVGKQWLLDGLSGRVTEGDAGLETLQVVADTIAQVVRSLPSNQRATLCDTLAYLVRYEHVSASLSDPLYRAALARLEADDRSRETAEFTLSDLEGRQWALKDLRGKVVLVNFWATWCPPCRKEMPDLQALYERFSLRGLVVLAISDETASKVEPFVAAGKYTYPILLDPGRKVHKLFSVEGIPKSFVYNAGGKLVAQAIDRRTAGQFLAMLQQAGL